MKIIRETAIAGKTIYRSIKVKSGCHSGSRKQKSKITKEAVAKNNYRLALRRLTLLLNANFCGCDSHITLTYTGEPPTKSQAASDIKKFIRRFRATMQRQGTELKYIQVTEYENKRIHHHIVVNTQDIELVNEIWQHGHIRFTALDDTGNYRKLAEYLIKETEKTFRLPDSVNKQRYSSSRNLIRPEIYRDEVSMYDISKDPKPIKGYYIPADEVRRYEHPITGIEHIEYYMIAEADTEPRKKWRKGKRISSSEHYKVNYEEVQANLFNFDILI